MRDTQQSFGDIGNTIQSSEIGGKESWKMSLIQSDRMSQRREILDLADGSVLTWKLRRRVIIARSLF